jgi:hypothetical protein
MTAHDAKKCRPKADELPSVGSYALRRQGLLQPQAEGYSRWISRSGAGTADIHVVRKDGWVYLDGHEVPLTFTLAFGMHWCRPAFRCPHCSGLKRRLYRVPQAGNPWSCAACAGVSYRSRGLMGGIDRAEHKLMRSAELGRARRPRERRAHHIRRLAKLIAAERELEEYCAAALREGGKQ